MKTIAEQLNIKDFPFIIKDKQGRELYHEDSNGGWLRREYDSSGNEKYLENSDGFWWKKEFDSAGRELYYEDSRGFWYKYEYDSEGNEIYCEDSSGVISDKRPKPDDVITLNGIKYKRIDD